MAQVNQTGPQPVGASSTTSGPQSLPAPLSSQIDLLVSLSLWAWPALTLAIQNAWGGSPQVSADKRDWFAGAVSELITSDPPQLADVDDLEEVLLQVMLDEFEVVVDDGSAEETARRIWKGVERLKSGDISEVDQMYRLWQEKQSKGGDKLVGIVRGEDRDGEETDWDEEEEEWNGFPDDQMDVEMDEAPTLVDVSRPKQKLEPEVDEEGFTKVVSKKRR